MQKIIVDNGKSFAIIETGQKTDEYLQDLINRLEYIREEALLGSEGGAVIKIVDQ